MTALLLFLVGLMGSAFFAAADPGATLREARAAYKAARH